MDRRNVYDRNYEWVGWFNNESAKEIASIRTSSGAYVSGKILLVTKSGKLIVNEWNNSGKDFYRFADNEEEIAEILAGSDDEYEGKLQEILNKYEL